MKFTLRQIEIFLAVAKTQSISGACKSLNMSQSAASTAIQELENRYDMKLFDRQAKRLKLSAHGKVMRTKAEALITHAKTFEQALAQSEEHGELRVGASLTIGNYLAFRYLSTFVDKYPKVEVNIEVGSTPDIVNKVLNFEADIGLIEAEVHNSDLESEIWRPDRMVAFCAPSHPAAKLSTLNDNDILQFDWIVREPGSAHRQSFDRAMQGLIADLNIRTQLTHNEAVKNAVKSGLGIGCLSEIAIQDELDHGVLIELKLAKREIRRHFHIIRHKQASITPALTHWLNMCRSKIPSQIDSTQ